jgi:hypothetical protein
MPRKSILPVHLLRSATPFATWSTPVAVKLGVTVIVPAAGAVATSDDSSGIPFALHPGLARTHRASIVINVANVFFI